MRKRNDLNYWSKRHQSSFCSYRNWVQQFVFLFFVSTIAAAAAAAAPSSSFDYVVSPNDEVYLITLTDVSTNVSDIPTVFQNTNSTVHVHGIEWQISPANDTTGAALIYTTLLNDKVVESATGYLPLEGIVPPSTIMAGWIVMEDVGRHNLTVALQVQYENDDNDSSNNNNSPIASTTRIYQCYFPILTLAPIVVLIILTYLTGNVEITISTTNLVTVVISQGDFFGGMEHLVASSLLEAFMDTYNGVIMMLIFFLSGIISLVEVTGGSKGMVRLVANFLTQTRFVQLLAFVCGVCYFWDDTLSILVLGHLFRPILDVAHTSRPLQALILDASAATITGVVILSTWLVWEIPLLQQELARIDTAEEIPALQMTPLEVLRESLRYSFYPIFFMLLMPLLLYSQRHIGQVLMYERLSQVYQSKHGGPKDTHGPCMPNLPVPPHTPCRFWNSLFPMALITVLFIFFWFTTGNTSDPDYVAPPGEQWIVTTYAYSHISLSWLQTISMAAAFYVVSLLLQWQEGDSILFLPFALPKIIQHNKAQKAKEKAREDAREEEDGLVHSHREEEDNILFQPLIPMMELIGSFFFGFSRVMPYVIQFMLAWALKRSWIEMGLDRWMASMFGEFMETAGPEMIPTAAFVTAFGMSMATGGATNGQAASILLPMAIQPMYARTYVTDPSMVFQVIGAILSGCIAGDHAAPLSNTTLLSCLASDCHLIAHIITQLPYVIIVFLMSVILGTGPVGFGIYPVGAGYFLGLVFLLFFVFFICFPVLDPSGQWDLATRLYIRCRAKKKKAKNDENSDIDDDNNNDNVDDNDDYDDVEEDPDRISNNFWEILQRDTIRAATAVAQGLPYNIEDCRHLMNPIDSGVTKGHGGEENLHRTSSSCGSSIVDDHDHTPTSPAAHDAEGQDEDTEDPASGAGRPVRIIATDGRLPGTTNDTVVGSSLASPG